MTIDYVTVDFFSETVADHHYKKVVFGAEDAKYCVPMEGRAGLALHLMAQASLNAFQEQQPGYLLGDKTLYVEVDSEGNALIPDCSGAKAYALLELTRMTRQEYAEYKKRAEEFCRELLEILDGE